MKLFVVLSIKEYREQVASMLQDVGVRHLSATDIIDYKKKIWAGLLSIRTIQRQTSIMLFSLVEKEIKDKALMEIDICNIETKKPLPVHVPILNIENFSKLF